MIAQLSRIHAASSRHRNSTTHDVIAVDALYCHFRSFGLIPPLSHLHFTVYSTPPTPSTTHQLIPSPPTHPHTMLNLIRAARLPSTTLGLFNASRAFSSSAVAFKVGKQQEDALRCE